MNCIPNKYFCIEILLKTQVLFDVDQLDNVWMIKSRQSHFLVIFFILF